MRPASSGLVLVAAALCVGAALLLAGRHLDEPGLYYDEVIQAGPALEFLRGDGEPLRIPGARATRFLGRWLPWMTQPYMGALKSQLLIPVFALFDADAGTLRGATLVWTLLGIPFVMLFANRLAGFPVALLCGVLLALDPSLLFLGRHDWGSFALGFLLKCAALWLVYAGFRGGSARAVAAVAAGGACLGLGVYNKIDFGVFLVAAGVALLIAAPHQVRRVVQTQRAALGAFCAGLAAGALPMAIAAGGALSVAGAATRGGSLMAELPEKWTVLRSVLDGSHFQRLMLSGGRFEDLASVSGASEGLGFAIFLGAIGTIGAIRWNPRLREPLDRASIFFALTALLSLVGILLTPRALRAHHFLNVLPFPQLAVASAVVLLWTRGPRLAKGVTRGMAVLMVVASLTASLRLDLATLELLRETGGRGRWSHAVEELSRTLPAGRRVVSLDWGFDGPVRFVAPDQATDEPIWRLRRGATRLEGGTGHLYLVHEPRYAVMPFGAALLTALADLPEGAAVVRIHRDRAGEPVFRSVEFTRPHELVYRGGRFEVKLR